MLNAVMMGELSSLSELSQTYDVVQSDYQQLHQIHCNPTSTKFSYILEQEK